MTPLSWFALGGAVLVVALTIEPLPIMGRLFVAVGAGVFVGIGIRQWWQFYQMSGP